MKYFGKKNQETWNVGKFRNYDEERLLFREKSFHFSKKLSSQKWEGAKNADASQPFGFKYTELENFSPWNLSNWPAYMWHSTPQDSKLWISFKAHLFYWDNLTRDHGLQNFKKTFTSTSTQRKKPSART